MPLREEQKMKRMHRRLALTLAVLTLVSMVAVASTAAASGGSIVVISSTAAVNIRAGGSTDYAIIGTAYPGRTYPYLGTTDTGWYMIQMDNGAWGCVSPKLAYVTGASGTSPSNHSGTCSHRIGTVRVSEPNGGYISMYPRRDANAGLLRHVFSGTYDCVGYVNNWYTIICEGFMGYVHAYDVTFTSSPENTYTPGAVGIVWIETQDMVNVRAGNNQYTDLLMSVCPGASFLCLGIDASTGWYKILLPTGQTGYVSNNLGTFTGLGNG